MEVEGLVSPRPSTDMVEFTTRIYAEKEGFSFWQDEICRHLSPSVTERGDPHSKFAASLKRVVIGKAGLCDISFSPMRNVRDARCLRRMPDDDFFVAVLKHGTGQLHQCGRVASIAAGDVVLYDSARPFDWRFGEESRMVVARLNRRQMQARLPQAEIMSARSIQADHPSASIIGNTLDNLVRLHGQLTPGCSQRLGNSLVDLIASSLEACLSPPDAQPGGQDVLLRSKRFLLDNLEDPDLDLDRVSRHLGVSVKTLCRAFASEGTTPIRWLWQQRLETASHMLQEGRIDQVGQVAMLCGFSDFSHFSRSFKKEFGVPPKAVLKHAASR